MQVYYPVVTASSQFDPSLITNLTGPSTLVGHLISTRDPWTSLTQRAFGGLL